jgi:hypothetical protein
MTCVDFYFPNIRQHNGKYLPFTPSWYVEWNSMNWTSTNKFAEIEFSERSDLIRSLITMRSFQKKVSISGFNNSYKLQLVLKGSSNWKEKSELVMIEYAWINSWNKVSPVNKGVIDVVACFSNSENWNDLFNDMKTIKRLKQRLAHSELSRSILFSQKCFYRNNAFVQHFFPINSGATLILVRSF